MMKSLDILIGLSVVMLVASMAVTVLTHIWTTVFNTRGTHLRDGLVDLLNQVHAVLSPEETKAIAEHILLHPLIRDGVNRMGSLIHRDELTRLLLEAAAGQGPTPLKNAVRAALADALANNGISDPGGALVKIREIALRLEKAAPALTNSARHDLAILEAASTPFVAKINCWFDQTVDRISARFTFKTRQITLVAALALAVAIQMDAVVLVNNLASDDALRGALVQKAFGQEKLVVMNPRDITLLASRDIFPVAASFSEWVSEWKLSKLPGIALSVLLLSLGAPFWFETLKNMLRLRSLIAVKDDDQRAQRSSPVT